MLEVALKEPGEQPLVGEVENYYRLLTYEDISAGARTEVRSYLERLGVGVDALQSDFVSHQEIHTFLTDWQEIPCESGSQENSMDRPEETIRPLESRTETVAETTVRGVREAGLLDLDEISVITSLDFVCEECGTCYDLGSLLE